MRLSAVTRALRAFGSRGSTLRVTGPNAHAITVLLLIALVVVAVPTSRTAQWFTDFNAFYCAGRTIAIGRDPYRVEPLAACEHAPKPAGFAVVARNVSLPAPLPPYALALFVPLALLPYAGAAAVWMFALLLALGLTIEAMHRITALPRAVLLAVFAPIDGYSSIYLGETVPLVVAALAAGSFCVTRGRPKLAAFALAPALIEPHVGLSAALALFLSRRAARLPLTVLAVAFIVLTLLAVGPATALEYARQVLPAHALSEVANTQQFSLTGFLHMVGVSDAPALHLGSASYFVMLVLGVALSYVLAQRAERDALIVALPPALAVTGGVFLHATQLPAALPAALIAFVRTQGNARRLIGVAIFLLALPLDQVFLGTIFIPLTGGAAFMLARDLLQAGKRIALVAGLAAAGAVLAIDLALFFWLPFPQYRLPPLHPHDLAEVSWSASVRNFSRWGPLVFDLARIPSWLGIVTLAAGLVRLVLARPKYRVTSGSLDSSQPRAATTELVLH